MGMATSHRKRDSSHVDGVAWLLHLLEETSQGHVHDATLQVPCGPFSDQTSQTTLTLGPLSLPSPSYVTSSRKPFLSIPAQPVFLAARASLRTSH